MEKKKTFVIVGIIITALMGVVVATEMKPTTDSMMSNDKPILLHIHPRLYLNVDGKPYFVPQNVGIEPDLWKDHTLDQYGMKGMAPLHTHTADGMIHVESTIVRNYTLGEFLDIWGLDLKGKIISVA
ncbi:MAG: hypothetical protein KGI02_09830, partial [Thaumarchaeota archaeon]|nr:hypothetical protein [Nitrososphaerota archaeon]